MKLQDQVCLFEQSLKLLSFGITTESAFKTARFRNSSNGLSSGKLEFMTHQSEHVHLYRDKEHLKDVLIVPSFTVSELANAVCMDKAGYMMPAHANYHKWLCMECANYKTMASLYCALLIKMLEDNVFSVSDVNRRLQS